MRKPTTATVSVLAVLTLVLSGCTDPAASQRTTATAAAGAATAVGAQAGVDPAVARAAAAQQQEDLTGDIDFSVPSGTFTDQVSVALSTAIAGAQIRYTTDGLPPTAQSTAYSGQPVALTSTTQLRAQAFVDGAPSGEMGTALYVARAVDAEHDLPLVVLDAYGAGKPQREWRDVAAMVIEPQGGTATLSQSPAVATRAGFHLRGQSSSTFAKSPYRLELWDNADDDADYPMLGMPAESDWVLKGPFADGTLIHDAFAYDLARDMGLQAPRYRFVELYLNVDGQPMAADDYQGVYLLVETIKNSPERLDLAKLTDADVTEPNVSGGYIFQFNAAAAEEPILRCTGGTQQDPCFRDLEVFSPNDPQPAQLTWINNYIQQAHDALHSENPSDPATGYPAYFDVDSWVNRIIHNELSKEVDAYIRSTHFHKDRGGKLVAGPVWDYDLGYMSFGGFGGGGNATQGWQFETFFGSNVTTDWFLRLMQDPAFAERAGARWQELRQGVLSDAQITARINALAAPLTNAAARNSQKWAGVGGGFGGFGGQNAQPWDQQLASMRTFVTQRAAWIDGSGWQATPGGPPQQPGFPGGGGNPPPPGGNPPADEVFPWWEHLPS